MKNIYLIVILFTCLSPALAQQPDIGQPSQTPPAKVAPPQRIRVSAGVAESNLLQKVDPVYPPMAKIANISGDVALQVIIGKDGTVLNVRALNGHPILIQAAIDAVKQWKYRPTVLEGQPVEVETRAMVKFRMDEKSSTSEPSSSSEPPPSSVVPPPPPPAPGSVGAQLDVPRKLRISAAVAEANVLEKVDPVYPQMAKIAHVSGDVVLQAIIGKNGAIQNLRAINGHPILIQAAMDAVRQWKYRPYLLNEEPVEVETTVIVRFHMDEKSPPPPSN